MARRRISLEFLRPLSPTPPIPNAPDASLYAWNRKRRKAVEEKEWLRLLLRPECRLWIPVFGYVTVTGKWRIPRRGIQEHLVYLVTENGFEGKIADKRVRMDAGSFFWIAPDTQHEFWLLSRAKPFTMFFFRFRLVEPGLKRDYTIRRDALVIENAWPMRPYLEALVAEARDAQGYQDLRLRSLLLLICSTVFRSRLASTARAAPLNGPQCAQLLKFVSSRMREQPGPGALAAEVRLSLDYFSRVFRATFGTSPRRWLVQERIKHAAIRLLESNLNVSELAYELGYKDVYQFSHQFKQIFGCSPKSYRRRQLH